MAIYANEPDLDTLLLLNPVKKTLQTTIMSSVNYTEIMTSWLDVIKVLPINL